MKRLSALLLAMLFLVPFAAAYGVTFYNPAWNPQDGKIFDLVEADKPYIFEVRNDDIAIRRITFVINREAQNAGVTVYNLRSVPTSLPEVPENDSYEFNEMKYSGFVPHDTTKFMYDFRVEKGWLENNSVPRQAVALHAYDNVLEQWDVLPTQVVSDDDRFVYFTAADDEGVHYLFIGKMQSGYEGSMEEPVEEVGEKEAEAAPEEGETAKPSAELPSEVTPVQLEKTTQPPAQPAPRPVPAAEQPPEDVSGKSDSKLVGALVLIAVAVIIVILYLVFGRKKLGYSVDKELNNYIGESLKRGKSKEEVRNRLLEVGWHHERVDKALSKHKEAASPVRPSGSMSLAEAKALAEQQRKEMEKKPAHKTAAKSKKK
ncbi:PGF-pre-PGF domain-containing protein [Candidatus Woesearchaeota archaeon]|nr:PGF-pre-PGF domain-containing protein [Candidatus Woesearchaeota archaeon]